MQGFNSIATSELVATAVQDRALKVELRRENEGQGAILTSWCNAKPLEASRGRKRCSGLPTLGDFSSQAREARVLGAAETARQVRDEGLGFREV